MHPRIEEMGKHGFLDIAHTQLHHPGSCFMPANCSSEASAPSYTQSTSSTIISPANHDVADAPCESSAQSGIPPLKEQDYIGMGEISSTSSTSLSERKLLMSQINLNLEEPDLRLGLGPSPSKAIYDNAGSHLSSRDNAKESFITAHTRTDVQESAKVVVNVAPVHPHSTGGGVMPSSKRLDAIPVLNSFCSVAVDSYTKSAKRLFSDTISQACPDVGPVPYVNAGAITEDSKAGATLPPGAVRINMQQWPDAVTKPLSKQSQMSYWGTPRASSWHSEFARNTSSYGQLPCRKHSESPIVTKGVISNLEGIPDEGPPAKEQVVGWPPVRSYRRGTINSGRSRPAGTESDSQAIYVKVNMDGIPIGRKVDLNAYSDYEELLSALEGMFYSPPVGEGARFLHARDFVLTYEDKEGDWMLVGDVPWGMFVNAVKRLRITRGSDSTCLGSSTSKNFS